jgi:hypothetical protein
MLTLQFNGTESGSVVPLDMEQGDAVLGPNKSTTPTLSQLGWTTGANVGIGFDATQEGNSGITLGALELTIWAADGITPQRRFRSEPPRSPFFLRPRVGAGIAIVGQGTRCVAPNAQKEICGTT